MRHALKIQAVSHWFPDKTLGIKPILYDVNLDIAPGQIVSLVGPSGCGKSTLLRAILGTHPPKEGTVYAADKPVVRAGPEIGIVFQNYSLFPDLKAEDLVADGPIMHKTNMFQRAMNVWRNRDFYRPYREASREILIKVGLEAALDKYPREMSGGMQQRVAIAQALVMKPKVLLLDEPFGALDEATRESLQTMLLTLYQENIIAKEAGKEPPYTILIVTHELNEAIYVADRVIGLSQFHDKGKLKGATVVYDRPTFVFKPGDDRNFNDPAFVAMRNEIRRSVFDSSNLANKKTNLTFWSDYYDGKVHGVLSIGQPEKVKPPVKLPVPSYPLAPKAKGYDPYGDK
jgi:NitT/TauT family transport system ATP-binding protein